MTFSSFPTDPLAFLQALLRCRSVTPVDDNALKLVGDALAGMGFEVHHLSFGPEDAPTPNLYAQRGQGRPALCLAGHTDVVPPGDGWSHDPFAGEVHDGCIYGRGTADMKGGIACFVAAVARHLQENTLTGSLSFLITGDEEGPARFGTKPVLEWMKKNDKIPDFFLLGEPTNPTALGDVVKIGRRGSLNAVITVPGVQGHVAYPHLADNPVHRLISALQELTSQCLDEGSEWFAPSSLQVVSVDVGNTASNVIPSAAEARLNIRFNDRHTGESLSEWIKEVVTRWAPKASVSIAVSGESFLTEPGKEVQLLSESIHSVTGRKPKLDTGGGTSDARFMTHYAPVAEFGLVGATMHKRDEHVGVQSLEELTQIYQHYIKRFGV